LTNPNACSKEATLAASASLRMATQIKNQDQDVDEDMNLTDDSGADTLMEKSEHSNLVQIQMNSPTVSIMSRNLIKFNQTIC
jgi:hypothetical protein